MRPGAGNPDTIHAGLGMLLMLGGVVIGAAVGLLTAPQSGKRTRRQIVHKAEDARDQVAELYDDVTEKVEDLRRGVTGKLAVGKTYIDKTKRGLVAAAPGLPNPLSRLISTRSGG
jgi:hypothetical protein